MGWDGGVVREVREVVDLWGLAGGGMKRLRLFYVLSSPPT